MKRRTKATTAFFCNFFSKWAYAYSPWPATVVCERSSYLTRHQGPPRTGRCQTCGLKSSCREGPERQASRIARTQVMGLRVMTSSVSFAPGKRLKRKQLRAQNWDITQEWNLNAPNASNRLDGETRRLRQVFHRSAIRRVCSRHGGV